jgi:hypothetical protein
MDERCLVCGGTLESDYVEQYEVDGDTVYVTQIGGCSQCGCSHKWIDVYKFTETKDLEMGCE